MTPANHAVQETMNDYWTERSVPYDEYQQRSERKALDLAGWQRTFSNALGDAPLDVLDVGTGSGYVACALAELGHHVTGIDLSAGMLERARLHAAAISNAPVFDHGDAVCPGYPPGAFDAVVNRYVTWTLRELDTALQNWFTLLRPGGNLLVVDALWFPEGLYAGVGANAQFKEHYGDEVRKAIPQAESTSIEPLAERVRAAGFVDVDVTELTWLLELDIAHGVAPDHEIVLQYLICGTRP